MTSLDELLVFISQLSPGFSERIKGASASEIQELAKWVGAPLPAVYEQFLLRMGRDAGGLEAYIQGSMRCSRLIEYYRDNRSEEGVLPPGCVVIEVDRLQEDCVSLELVPGGEPRVVYTDLDEIECPCAESFVGYLAQVAFMAFQYPSLPERLGYVSSFVDMGRRRVLEDVRRVLLDMGFVEEWFSDQVAFFGTRAGVFVRASQRPERGLFVLVSSKEIGQAEKVGGLLERLFNVRRG